MTDKAICRTDGRCQYAIDHGAEGLGHCPTGKCCMPDSTDQADELRAQFKKATAPAVPGLFQHFASDEQRQSHLDDVAAGVERGELPF